MSARPAADPATTIATEYPPGGRYEKSHAYSRPVTDEGGFPPVQERPAGNATCSRADFAATEPSLAKRTVSVAVAPSTTSGGESTVSATNIGLETAADPLAVVVVQAPTRDV